MHAAVGANSGQKIQRDKKTTKKPPQLPLLMSVEQK